MYTYPGICSSLHSYWHSELNIHVQEIFFFFNITNALWIIWAIKNHLLMQKSCSNFTFLTLSTTKALILRNKSPVQVWNYILDLWVYSIFCETFGIGLPEISDLRKIAKDRDPTCPGTSTDLWRKLLDHWYLFKFVHLALKTTWNCQRIYVVYSIET